MTTNLDSVTVAAFGEEWSHFDQSEADDRELRAAFDRYFTVFPWDCLPVAARGFDLGCGSGRWAHYAAERVGTLYCIDASSAALAVAKRNLTNDGNCEFFAASVDCLPLPDNSMDFGYSIGVLHHVPDTEAGIKSCVAKLKEHAPLLLYLYYAFDNRPRWFRAVWRASDQVRKFVARLPFRAKLITTHLVAAGVYWPLARFSAIAERAGADVHEFPLSMYRDHSFYTMRTDAFDRFGTRLEQRFTAQQIVRMMEAAGLVDIRVSDREPYWCAVGFKGERAIGLH
jgi:SAM-dependent methyltransferase